MAEGPAPPEDDATLAERRALLETIEREVRWGGIGDDGDTLDPRVLEALLRVPAVTDAPLLEGHRLRRALQQVGGKARQLLASRLEDRIERGAAHRQPAAGAGTTARGQERRIAVTHLHLGEVHTQLIGHDLGECRVRSLPMGGYASSSNDMPRRRNVHLGAISTIIAIGSRGFDHRC